MPSKKPRISIILPDQVYDTVSRLAKLQGQSRASFVAGLVCAIDEPLERTVSLLEAAKAAPASMHAHLRQAALAAEIDLMRSADQGSAALLDMLAEARRIAGKPAAGVPEGGQPPLTNRGVRWARQAPPLCPTCGRSDCPGSRGGDCWHSPILRDEGGGCA